MELIFLAELCNVLEDLLYEIVKVLTVNIVFESELCVVLQYFLKDLIWCLLINAFSVAD